MWGAARRGEVGRREGRAAHAFCASGFSSRSASVVAASRELFSLGVGRPSRPGAPISTMIIVMAFGIFGLRWLFFCARIVGGQCAAPDRAAA